MKKLILISALLLIASGCGNHPDTRLSCECIEQVIGETENECNDSISIVINDKKKTFTINNEEYRTYKDPDTASIFKWELDFGDNKITHRTTLPEAGGGFQTEYRELDRITLVYVFHVIRKQAKNNYLATYQCKVVEGV